MSAGLTLYVYNMSRQYTLDIKEHVESVAYSKLGKRGWLSSVTRGHFTHFENLRTHGADVIMLQKLLHHTRQTLDPSVADLFLIPLFGGLDTILGWGHGLKRINPAGHRNVLEWDAWASENLHAWRRVPHRHLVLFNMNDEQVPSGMNPATVVHLGPSRRRLHHIIVPYLILEQSFFASRRPRPEKRFFAYVQMTTSRNAIRRSIEEQLRHKDNVLVDSGVIGKPQRDTVRLMRRSTFCIAPAGDSASFCARFYFALLSGCIPVRIDTYGSQDAYPYVGPAESLRELVVNVSPADVRAQRLLAVLHNVTDVDDRLRRIRAVQKYLLHNPADSEDASTMVISQLLQRKRCADRVSEAHSLYATRVDATANCSLPDFTANVEMCWKREIDERDVVALQEKILRAMTSC